MKKGMKNPRASRNWVRCDFWKKTEITVAEAAVIAGVTVSRVEDWLYVLDRCGGPTVSARSK